jgi:uncharacterized protein YndB with AHSA1/START domain
MLSAPIDFVWEVWTNPEHIANRWGPTGFTNTIRKMDVVPGGEWRLTMRGSDGKKHPDKSVFIRNHAHAFFFRMQYVGINARIYI